MSAFVYPVDIGNRACQHCGVPRMDRTLGFTENSKRAIEIGPIYDGLRRAELMRSFWGFAIKKAPLRAMGANTMILAPSLWVSTTTYFVGSIISDDQGTLWESVIPDNLGNQPQNTPAWRPYFGPMTADPYDSTTTYFAGELAYTTPGDGTNRVYRSLLDNNADNPATAAAWDATVTYIKNQVVVRSAVNYMSLIDFNLNQDPSASPLAWAIGTTYAIGNTVCASNGVIYTSLSNGNVGNDPVADAGVHWQSTNTLCPWTRTFTAGMAALKWRQIGGIEFPSGVTLATPNIVYSVGAGPDWQTTTRNVYRLPANFLRLAPQDPKAGAISYLGAPGYRQVDDWLIESEYLTTWCVGTILLRFVADVVDVRLMHEMFCEGLGARIALEVVEPLTNSTTKQQAIRQAYDRFMREASLVDAIEEGPVESPLDDYIACRG